MKCPKCHSKISNDCLFCPKCGAEMVLTCPKCGNKNQFDASFCSKCGQPLKQSTGESKEPAKIVETQSLAKKEKTVFILSIIAMAGMIFSILLMLGLSFAPFQTDTFYPASMFTIFGYSIEVFQTGFVSLIKSYQYLTIASAIILLLLLLAIVVMSVVFLAINIPKMIKAIIKKDFCDFSKSTLIVYLLFISAFITFNLFVRNENILSQSTSASVVIICVVVTLFFAFNSFVKEYKKQEFDLFFSIIKPVLQLLSFIFIQVIICSLGGLRFVLLVTESSESVNRTNMMQTGNAGVISYIVSLIKGISSDSSNAIIAILAFTGLSLLNEIAIWCLSFQVAKDVSTHSTDKQSKFLKGIILSSIMMLLSILVLVFGSMANNALNTISSEYNSVKDASMTFASSYKSSLTIVCIVMAALLLSIQSACLIVENIKRGKEQTNENK